MFVPCGLAVIALVAICGAAAAQPSTGVLQATYLGGSRLENARAMAVDPASGDVIVVGIATSDAFPAAASGAQPTLKGLEDGFVVRLSPDLRTLKQATYIGGGAEEQADAVAVDPASGDILVAGFTASSDLPGTAGGAQPQRAGQGDAFVARFSADLSTLRQATYLGGTGNEGEALLGIAIAPVSGAVFVTGTTDSADFPGTAGAAQPICGDFQNDRCIFSDGFVARLSGDLKTLVRSTYVGGMLEDDAYAVAVHPSSGEIFVGGDSAVDNFTRIGVVSRYSADLEQLKGRMTLGDTNATVVWGLTIDPESGDVFAVGETASPLLEGTEHGAQPTFGGGSSDSFVARLNRDLSLLQATYLGGTDREGGITAAAIEPGSGAVIVTGTTTSADFPATAGGAQPMLQGGVDGFLARLSGNLQSLEQSTYLGGTGRETGYGIAIGAATGEVVVAGATSSMDFPATAGGGQPTFVKPPLRFEPEAGYAARLSADLRGGAPGATATAESTPTQSVTPTATAPPTATAQDTPTETPPTAAPCPGDCGHDGMVTVDELIKGVNIALGHATTSLCPPFDLNGNGMVTIDELVRAVNAALSGCA